MTKKKVKRDNEILPLLDVLCKHKIIPRYGEPVRDGFTINDAYELLEKMQIHYSKKTVERRLNALVDAGILQKCMAGREMAYRRSK
jgi:hypothetical protein